MRNKRESGDIFILNSALKFHLISFNLCYNIVYCIEANKGSVKRFSNWKYVLILLIKHLVCFFIIIIIAYSQLIMHKLFTNALKATQFRRWPINANISRNYTHTQARVCHFSLSDFYKK